MKNKYLFVTNEAALNTGINCNPVYHLDNKLMKYFPEFYSLNYDLRILAHKVINYPKTKEFQDLLTQFPLFKEDHYIDVALPSQESLKEICLHIQARSVYLNGFTQEHFNYIAPFIKDSVEIIYLCKCNTIDDLSMLSEFYNLQCVNIYWNNKLKTLWNMEHNNKLKVLSFTFTTKLSNVETLKESTVEFLTLDGESDSMYMTDFHVDDLSVFKAIPNLKHLTINYKNCRMDY